jgi:two-component sensor histidine kinase
MAETTCDDRGIPGSRGGGTKRGGRSRLLVTLSPTAGHDARADEVVAGAEALVRLRAENLTLRTELLELRAAARTMSASGSVADGGEASSGDVAAELQASIAALEEAASAMRKIGHRSIALARGLREKDAVIRRKDLLISEMARRVRNSLQLSTSLLGVPLAGRKGAGTSRALQRSLAAIEAVGQLHALLCTEAGTQRIELGEYLRRICAFLRDLVLVDDRHRSLVVEAESVTVPAEAAQALGLVVNELVTNAFQHAFAEDGRGTVWVQLGRLADGRLRLLVADDGKGLPQGFAVARDAGLGLRLVASTAGQLGAELVARSQGGAQMSLHLPRNLARLPADAASRRLRDRRARVARTV